MAPQLQTYSFLDVHGTLAGPGGVIALGTGAGAAKEGISIEPEAKNTMTIGADGSAMHSLKATIAGRILVRLLKTSPVNAQLEQMFQVQAASSLLWGQNVLTITNPVTGDDYACTGVAFAQNPRNDYAEEAGMLEWAFDAGYIAPVLGAGISAFQAVQEI